MTPEEIRNKFLYAIEGWLQHMQERTSHDDRSRMFFRCTTLAMCAWLSFEVISPEEHDQWEDKIEWVYNHPETEVTFP